MGKKASPKIAHLPRVERSLHDFSPPRQLAAALRKATLSAALVGVSLAGGVQGASGSPLGPQSASPLGPKIINRRERSMSGPFVLELAAPAFSPATQAFHRSHRSHSSHRSHYSSVSPSRPPTTSRPPAPSTPTVPDLASDKENELESTVIKIDRISASDSLLIGKDKASNLQAFRFSSETKVRILSPEDQTTNLGTLQAFTGSLPFNLGKEILVHWKLEGAQKVAVRVTMLEK